MTPKFLFFAIVAATAATDAFAQSPNAPQATPRPAQAPAADNNSGDLASAIGVPKLDPGNNIVSWNGQNWNIANQTLFRARFEKFLNAPEQTDVEFQAYQGVMRQIADKLNPIDFKPSNLDDAWVLLKKASNYPIDAGLSGALADIIYTCYLAQGERDRLKASEIATRKDRETSEWNYMVGRECIAARSSLRVKSVPPRLVRHEVDGGGGDKDDGGSSTEQDLFLEHSNRDIGEQNTNINASILKQGLTIVQAKLEFQSFILQLFMQRRFQHVVIGTNFYRNLFGDGDTKLQVNQRAQDLLTGGSGLPATLGLLQSLSVEAMRDAKEGADATVFLMSENKLNAATEQMQQAFVEGEYMPDLRNISRDAKGKLADYIHKGNRLLTAIDAKDYDTAEGLTKSLQAMATDVDVTQPRTAVAAVKNASALHLAKAQNAAMAGDRATFEAELKAAGDLWPTNPDLIKVAAKLFSQENVQQKAINTFDGLLVQKSYRQIWDHKAQFLAATAQDENRQKQLNDVLAQVQEIELVIARAQELQKHGDNAGAWEAVETEGIKYGDDSKLSQLRAQLTSDASDFVHSIRTAQDLERKDEWGSAIAWYLKAQDVYPESALAQTGIDSITKKVMSQTKQPLVKRDTEGHQEAAVINSTPLDRSGGGP